MAGSVKGLLVEIGGDTSGLQKALSKVNSVTSSLSKELKGINTLLKLDPKNTELLAQKQTVLKQNIQQTTEKLKQLKTAQDLYIKSGGNLNSEQYRNLQREIISTQNKLKELKLESSNWTKASEGLKTFSTKLESIGSTITNIGQKFMGLTALIGTGGVLGVKYNAQLEKYKTALKTLTGSEEEASKIMTQIQNDAAKTPFDVKSLTEANQLLLATGLSAEETRDIIFALGDAIAASGGGSDEFSRMAYNLQQVKNLGKASAVDIKQFGMAGIDIYGVLADYLNVSKEEAANMTVTWEDLSGALKYASQEGGKYFGAMGAQSETLNGKITNLKDTFNRLVGALTESLIPTIKTILDKAIEFIEKFNSLDEETKKVITNTLLIVAAIGPVLLTLGKVITTISTIAGALSKVAEWIGLTSVGAKGLSGVIAAATNPITLVIAAIAAATAALIYLYNTNDKIKASINEIVQEYLKRVQKLIEFLRPYIKSAIDWFVQFWDTNVKDTLENLRMLLEEFFEAAKQVYNNFIFPIVDNLMEKLAPAFDIVFRNIGIIVEYVLNNIMIGINTVIGVFRGLIEFLTGVFTGDWEKAWSGIKGIFGSIFNGLGSMVKNALNAVIRMINNGLSHIGEIRIPDWVPFYGGRSFYMPRIPELAKGGIVNSPTLSLIGEGKSAEAVIPLDKTLTKYMAKAIKEAGGNNNTINVNFYPQKMNEAELNNAVNYINRKFGLAY